ncbi:hypothetical protein CC1G_04859 [Coprinopsis cinerea okayama7|uniref:Uncharacterized protein n=1 Tax=Coprinopsis cinerea (strain Okayama-7 / 130 / ATCC MYA-4618 / FGSC 9003) TaxID=240176 RepID=A8PFU3_COPC7|nr:hypothetical protein CC1G_04859 [Coprinopsis cinerea okayama7\|eukprot:XP_001841015.2 hypothetical protein CC1G_04859 [Coprinopsis cinerea okayama7\
MCRIIRAIKVYTVCQHQEQLVQPCPSPYLYPAKLQNYLRSAARIPFYPHAYLWAAVHTRGYS